MHMILLTGLMIGFSIAAPVGAIGILCINRTLVQGRLAGLISGLGAATADGVYGCIAGLGLTFISRLLIEQQFWLRLVGGIFLCYLGIKTFIDKPAQQKIAKESSSLIHAYVSTFFLTITNPLTILAFVAIFAGAGLTDSPSYRAASLLVLGVFSGSACWWLLLCSGVSLLRKHFTPQKLQYLNRISGTVLTGFGLIALVNLRK
ncbi:MAG: LysE family translocator [Cyanophyceae cyanobacterium]